MKSISIPKPAPLFAATVNERALEKRLRRVADRYGLQLVKSRSRDPHAPDFGLFALVDVRTGGVVTPTIAGRWICSWTLEEVDDYLNSSA